MLDHEIRSTSQPDQIEYVIIDKTKLNHNKVSKCYLNFHIKIVPNKSNTKTRLYCDIEYEDKFVKYFSFIHPPYQYDYESYFDFENKRMMIKNVVYAFNLLIDKSGEVKHEEKVIIKFTDKGWKRIISMLKTLKPK